MHDTQFDVFIIGGGINGVGIAADAAGRGLKVALCEKNDFASGTSSASTKLIHGGLRYLEMFEFKLVRSALIERQILLNKAPHLISPLQFIIPQKNNFFNAFKIRAGLFLYDHLAAHKGIPNSSKVSLKHSAYQTHLKSNYVTGFAYYDCNTDDARLVIENALAAKQDGANFYTRTECISCEYDNSLWTIQIKDLRTQKISLCTAKTLVNASGPWIKHIQENVIKVEHITPVQLIKGSHLVIPKMYEGDFAYLLQTQDKRVVFIIPYQNKYSLIGTTDLAVEHPENREVSIEEQEYLFNVVHEYFDVKLTSEDVVWSYAGVRCLQGDDHNQPSKITRDYKIDLLASKALLTVVSGKLTTYRQLSQKAVDLLAPYFENLPASKTKLSKLPGSNFKEKNFTDFFAALKKSFSWMPQDLLTRYAHSYGAQTYILLQNTHCINDLGEKFSHALYAKEIEYLIRYEWLKCSEDLLWRRTKLGLEINNNEISNLDSKLPALLEQFACYLPD